VEHHLSAAVLCRCPKCKHAYAWDFKMCVVVASYHLP